MAAAPQSPLHMRSTDLIIKEPLDYGGFGEVYLCYHVTLGHVVLKTMYTGHLRNEDSKRSLLEEGSIMASLNHERVVKLLGVIMEDRDCSLVMELIPRGNLLIMLETVHVPLSIKGRIILEILEGMIYLTERLVIHKDIKPENILVDKDFHIKIADLGLATCQTWSKLTKQESRRKSRGRSSGVRGAGTLSYMAPEHLESIHTASTEKSDVYSFAIVLWVVLTGQEPYANARSEDHISQCVRNGDRPAEDLVPRDTPIEIINLMKRCWHGDPQQRPTFKECYDDFLPFFEEKLESQIEEDLLLLRKMYEGPDELVDRMKSLSVINGSFPPSGHDAPAPLVSSDTSLSAPVEASIEDLHKIQYEQPVGCIQTDARPDEERSDLEEKLHRELEYHKNGSYSCESQPEADRWLHTSHSNPSMPSYSRASEQILRQPEQEKSSVHSWTKTEPVQPTSPEEAMYRPSAAAYESLNFEISSPLPRSVSTPSISQLNQQHPHSHLDRCLSGFPVSDTSAPDNTLGRLFAPSKCGSSQDPGSLYIQNASGIQIGSNNTMSIRGYESPLSSLSVPANDSANSPIKEAIRKYEDHAVTEAHLDLLRDNIGIKWKRCARRLGLSSVEIETIEHDFYRDGLPEMVHQMLERWKTKEGSIGCTIGKLYRAIDGNIKVDVIQKILETCTPSSSLS